MKKKTDTFVKMTAAVMIFVLIFALCACGQETAQKVETAAQAETEVNADPGA